MSLHIVWASPWGQRARLASFGAPIVTELLARGHRVDVLRSEVGLGVRERPHPTAARVHPWHRAAVRDLVRGSDALVLNICDDYRACGAILGENVSLGGLGIVHDGSLRRLAEGWVRRSPNRRAVTAAIGDPDAWVASGLAGALAHRSENLATIESACPGPVRLAPSPPQSGDDKTLRAYVDALLALIEEAIPRRPAILAGLALGRRLAELGYAYDAPEVTAIAARVSELFGPP